MQKHVNLLDLVKSFPTSILVFQNLASILPRTSLLKFIYILFFVTGVNSYIGTTPPRTNAGANDGRSGSHKVLAFKLPKAESKEALLQSLGTFFGKFGPVQELNVLKDKQGNNFCVTHFATDEAAQNCLRRSDEHYLLGTKVEVKPDQKRDRQRQPQDAAGLPNGKRARQN